MLLHKKMWFQWYFMKKWFLISAFSWLPTFERITAQWTIRCDGKELVTIWPRFTWLSTSCTATISISFQNSTFSWNDLDLSSDTTTILRTWNFFRNGFLISSEEVWTCLRWNKQNKIGNYCELFILLICIFLISLQNRDKHETISLSLSTLVSRVSCDLDFGGSGELCKNGLDWQITTVWNLSDLFLFVEYSN